MRKGVKGERERGSGEREGGREGGSFDSCCMSSRGSGSGVVDGGGWVGEGRVCGRKGGLFLLREGVEWSGVEWRGLMAGSGGEGGKQWMIEGNSCIYIKMDSSKPNKGGAPQVFSTLTPPLLLITGTTTYIYIYLDVCSRLSHGLTTELFSSHLDQATNRTNWPPPERRESHRWLSFIHSRMHAYAYVKKAVAAAAVGVCLFFFSFFSSKLSWLVCFFFFFRGGWRNE